MKRLAFSSAAQRGVWAAAGLGGHPPASAGLWLAREDAWHFAPDKGTGNAEKFSNVKPPWGLESQKKRKKDKKQEKGRYRIANGSIRK